MALLNCVTNALDAMPDGGTLSITATGQASHVRVEVADSGPGLPAAIMDRLFDPWVTTKPAGQGSAWAWRSSATWCARTAARCAPTTARPARCSSSISRRRIARRPGLTMPRILVVDDDAETCTFLEELLEAPDRQFVSVQDPDDAPDPDPQRLVRSADLGHQLERPALGARSAAPVQGGAGRPVVLISGFGTLETAIEAVRAGAFDYISKPFVIAEVKRIVERALEQATRAGEPAAEMPASPPGSLIGRTAPMLDVYKQIAHAADSTAPVLIVGESGSGKELVARAIHGHSARAREPFVADQLRRDCRHAARVGAVRASAAARSPAPSPITKACSSRRPAARCCSTRSATPRRHCRCGCCACSRKARCGRSAARERSASRARVIAATNVPLEQAVADGRFRQDLFYRLSVIVDARAAAARPAGRHPAADRQLPRRRLPAGRAEESALGRGARRADALRVAGQRARAAEHDRAPGRLEPRLADRGLRSAGEHRRARRARRSSSSRSPICRRSTTSRSATCCTCSTRPTAIGRAPRRSSASTAARSTGWPSGSGSP